MTNYFFSLNSDLDYAPAGGQNEGLVWTLLLGFRRMKAMTKHRSHSVAFKRQAAEEFIVGETLHALSERHDISRQLIPIWVGKFEAGALDDDLQVVDLIQEYEAKIAALSGAPGAGDRDRCRRDDAREWLRGHPSPVQNRLAHKLASIVLDNQRKDHPLTSISRMPTSFIMRETEPLCADIAFFGGRQ